MRQLWKDSEKRTRRLASQWKWTDTNKSLKKRQTLTKLPESASLCLIFYNTRTKLRGARASTLTQTLQKHTQTLINRLAAAFPPRLPPPAALIAPSQGEVLCADHSLSILLHSPPLYRRILVSRSNQGERISLGMMRCSRSAFGNRLLCNLIIFRNRGAKKRPLIPGDRASLPVARCPLPYAAPRLDPSSASVLFLLIYLYLFGSLSQTASTSERLLPFTYRRELVKCNTAHRSS